MEKQRAKEIAASPVMAYVTHNGVPVYIQHVDHEKNTVRICDLHDRDNEREVAVNSLSEQ
jgi:small acid-soluble spore protein H (minor)